MPSVKKRGESWQATYRAPDGRERTKTFPRKLDADRWVTDQVAAANRGEWIDPRDGKTTFGEYATTWRAAQIHRPSTMAQVETNLRRHVLPTFGDRRLSSIRTTEVQAWVRRLEGDLAPATVQLVYGYVATVFRAAVHDRLISSSPCVKIKLPKPSRRQVVPLKTSVVEALRDAVPDRYRTLVVLGAGTGVRQGEAFGLTVDRVDFLRRRLTVDRQLVQLVGAPPSFAPPKTEASVREIPLPGVVLDALSAHLASYPAGPHGLVFTNEAGSPIRRTAFSDIWRRAVARSGAPAGTGYHELRHYYASLLIRAGESVKVVQERLGHEKAQTTLDVYGHLWPDSDDRTRDAIDAVLGGAADIPRTLRVLES